MADNIRGLTVEISADSKKFNSGMNELRKEVKSSQAELSALQKSLELEYDADTFTRAQKVAQEAIDATAKSADTLQQRLQYLEDIGSIDTAEYRKLQTELAQTELKGKQLQKQLEKINTLNFDAVAKKLKTVGDNITQVGQKMAGISAGAAAAVAGFTAIGVKTIETASKINDLTKKFGVSAEKIQEWQYIATQTGTDFEVFNKAMVKARATMIDLSTGKVSDATKAFQALGLNLNNYTNSDEMFDGIITALSQVENGTLKASYANAIFGDKMVSDMLPLLNASSEELAKLKDEFNSFSTLSGEQVKSLAQFNDVINRIKESFKNVALQIGTALLPLFEKLANIVETTVLPKFQKLQQWMSGLSESQKEFAAKALLVVAALAPLALVMGKVINGVGGIINLIPKLMSGLSALAAHPIILIIAAVVAVLVLLYTKCEAFREAINNLVGTLTSALQPILGVVTTLLNSLMGALMPIVNILGGVLANVLNMLMASLTPMLESLSLMFQLIEPLITLALIPLQLALQQLSIPLGLLGQLLNWLSPLFTWFSNIVKNAFAGITKVINIVLGGIEKAVNWVIDMINGLINTYNSLLGWLTGNIGTVGYVKLKLNNDGLDTTKQVESVDTTPPAQQPQGDFIYDNIDTSGTPGDTYNYDYSQQTKTQNVTVVVQNYAQEVDVDNLVRQINIKLAEAY